MRLASLVVALAVAGAVARAGAGPASLVVRPAPGLPAGPSAARLAAALAELPAPPLLDRPVFAGPAPRSTRAGVAPAAAARAELAAWRELRFASPAARDAALAALRSHPDLALAEPVRALRLGATAAGEIPPNVWQVRAPEALARITPDSALVVGVVDTGCDLTHPDLVRRLWRNDDPPGNASPQDDERDQNGDGLVEDWERDDDDDNGFVDDLHGYDFTDAPGQGGFGDDTERDPDPSDEQGHGTHVAGILAADGSLQGVAPFVQVMVLRAAYSTAFSGQLETDDAAAAIVYAVDQGVRILNLSWGDTEESLLIREVVQYALDRGVLVVAAAGNGTSDTPHFPSAQAGVLAVGSVDGAGQRSSFSNFGPGVLLYAPGERHAGPGGGIVSLAPGGGRASLRGTSMAAPHVAGGAAIVMCRSDRPDAERVRELLVEGASRRAGEDWSAELSHGVVDAREAVDATASLVVHAGAEFVAQESLVRLAGTVAGADLARWRADVRPLAAGSSIEAGPWYESRRMGELLGSAALAGAPAGDWEYIVTAESGAGVQRTSRGVFTVDWTAPQVDTLFATAAWRAAEPRWLVSVAADEPVSVQIVPAPGVRFSSPGRSRRAQLECPAPGAAAATWGVSLRNAAGLERDTTLAGVPALPPWPAPARLFDVDSTPHFRPTDVPGRAPGGAILVWGNGLAGDSVTTMQAWQASGGRLALQQDTGRLGRPVASADANGDGAEDLLFQIGGRAHWLLSRRAGSAPDSLGASRRAERALGLFQFDGDAPCEALLSSGDSLLVYDDAAAGEPRLMQILLNPSRTGFNVFGADAAVGDLDGDGRTEIACGDAEGALAVFESDVGGSFELEWSGDADGVYAYDFTALPGGGFVTGRQQTRALEGDGFPTAAYEFRSYAARGSGYARDDGWSFLAPTNELRAGSTAVLSPATSVPCLALVRGADLYLLRHAGGAWMAEAHESGAAGEPPVLCDLDGDGALDLVLRTPAGARWLRQDETYRGPHALVAEPLAADRVRLGWDPGDADSVRVRRRDTDSWATLGATTARTWLDSTLVPGTRYEYQLEGVRAGGPGGQTNAIALRARGLPRLLRAESLGPASVRVWSSNPFGDAALLPERWTLEPYSQPRLHPTQVTLSAAGREATLGFAPLPAESADLILCGTARLFADSLRDDQNARYAPAPEVSFLIPCREWPFAVQRTWIENGAVLVRFNRDAAAPTLSPENFTLTWNGQDLPIVAVSSSAPYAVALQVEPGVQFVGRGVPYLLRLDAAIQAADGTPLADPETEYVLRVEGRGAGFVFPYPNPVRGGNKVTFGETSAGTRIDVFTLEGERVRSLDGSLGGGIVWDLSNGRGERVAPGAYIYVARDAAGSSRGRLVVLR